jgi:transposase
LVLTPGNTADCVIAETCVSRIPGVSQLLADKGYDTDAFRAFLKANNVRAVIPGKSNRKKRIRHDKQAYKGRNVVERCFCRLKDFRRIATRRQTRQKFLLGPMLRRNTGLLALT